MSKKLLAPLATVLMLTLAACGDAPSNTAAPPADAPPPATTPTTPPPATTPPANP